MPFKHFHTKYTDFSRLRREHSCKSVIYGKVRRSINEYYSVNMVCFEDEVGQAKPVYDMLFWLIWAEQ